MGTDRSPALRYGVAVSSVIVVTLIRLLAQPIMGTHARFLSYVLAVMVTGWYGGLGPGLLATALCAVVGPLLFPELVGLSASMTDRYALWELGFFAVIGVVISILNDVLKSEVAERRHAEQASRAQTRALVRVLEELTQEQRFEAFPGIVLAAIVEQFEADSGTLWSYDEITESSEKLLDYDGGRIVLADDPNPPFSQVQIDNRKRPDWERIKAAHLRGECVLLTNFPDQGVLDRGQGAALAARGVRSVLAVPMLFQGRLLGIYTLRSTRREKYSPHDLALAQALAHQATLAIQMARLAEQARQTAILEERNRMAGEIHDGLGQAFTGILLQLGALELFLADSTPQEGALLESVRNLARDGLTEARRSAHALRPRALEKEDLAEALAHITEQLSADPSTRIRFHLHGSPRPLPSDVADHLLRIGQEALTNALRHARAGEIVVDLTFAVNEVHLCVQDDGRGIPTDTPRHQDGFGLNGMRERAGLIGAKLEVISTPGAGTRVGVAWQFPTG